MEVFDKDGNLIEGMFSKDEVDEHIEAARKAVLDEVKPKEEEKQNTDEIPAWAKPLFDKVGTLESHNTQTFLGKVTLGLDADKRKDIEEKYKNLSGYDETSEGLARRAEDAYLVVTGEKFNAGTVDMSNLMGSGGGKSVIDSKVTTEADKTIQSLLGITSADVEKYGKK